MGTHPQNPKVKVDTDACAKRIAKALGVPEGSSWDVLAFIAESRAEDLVIARHLAERFLLDGESTPTLQLARAFVDRLNERDRLAGK